MEILNDIPSLLMFEQYSTSISEGAMSYMRISKAEPRENPWQTSATPFITHSMTAIHEPIDQSTGVNSFVSHADTFAQTTLLHHAMSTHDNPNSTRIHYDHQSMMGSQQSIHSTLMQTFGDENLVCSSNQHSWTDQPRPMSGSNTCISDHGSTNSSSDGSEIERLDHLMGLVFDHETETGPLDHVYSPWFPDHHVLTTHRGIDHFDGITATDTGQYSPDTAVEDAAGNMFEASNIMSVTCPTISFGPTHATGPHPGRSLQERPHGLNEKLYPDSPASVDVLMPVKPSGKVKRSTNDASGQSDHPNRWMMLAGDGSTLGAHTMSSAAMNSGAKTAAGHLSVEIRQDNTREFGLNPILGSPLARSVESEYSEICLVHLLIAGAEAVATRDLDLASVILVRLKELVSCSGTTMQRVAAYFSDGLHCRIIESGKQHRANAHDLMNSSSTTTGMKMQAAGYNMIFRPAASDPADILAAFQILHEVSPYIKFGHFSANQAILEAVEREASIHIVDFEIMEGIQWPPLMQALASSRTRAGSADPPHLRITALYRPHGDRGLATIHETGKRLAAFAQSVNLPFTFSPVRVDDDEHEFGLHSSHIKLAKGEALVVNCMLHLPHMPQKTTVVVSAFLRAMRRLSPILLTLVEEELGCSTSTASAFFFEALHHYSAICDSLEDSLSAETRAARMLVERVFLAPRINRTVSLWSGGASASPGASTSDPMLSGGHNTAPSANPSLYNWCSLVRSTGFKSLPLSFHNVSQAKLLLGLYKDGFKLDERSDRLVLGWRSKPLYAASTWKIG